MTSPAPAWAHCGQGAAPGAPFAGCTGITVAPSGRCLTHADTAEQAAYLATLSPGADLDLRGTTFDDPALLDRVLAAVTDPTSQRPIMGTANFESATFHATAGFDSAAFDTAWFNQATFHGVASFRSATFLQDASFDSATCNDFAWFSSAVFRSTARFDSATFNEVARFGTATFALQAWFDSATFNGDARFDSATFNGAARFDAATFRGLAGFDTAAFARDARFDAATFHSAARFAGTVFHGTTRFSATTFSEFAWFDAAAFHADTWFARATFNGTAHFDSATFHVETWFDATTFIGNATFVATTFRAGVWFRAAVFEQTASLGPLVCADRVDLSGATFGAAVTVEIAAEEVRFRRTRWTQPAAVWLRYAEVDLSDALAEYPLAVAARGRLFTTSSGAAVSEAPLAGLPTDQVRVTSLRGVDAAQLVLTDVDLSGCLLTGTVHLDQIRLEGDCRFAVPPPGLHRRGRLRLVRYTRRNALAEEHHWRGSLPGAVPGWQAAPPGGDLVQPRALAAVYRALRKSYEDSSNEPGAADFYYGEMEMRRADPRTPAAERGLLAAYWALSGYGLRATRALGWLLLSVTATVFAMMLWGIPQQDTPQLSTGTLTGRHITLTTDNPDPENPTGPRLTGQRFEKSLRVVVNSVIFRSSGQDLTTTGTYTEMASRLTEPVLLGFAVLAVRGRVKR